jgi:hypothetical protein
MDIYPTLLPERKNVGRLEQGRQDMPDYRIELLRPHALRGTGFAPATCQRVSPQARILEVPVGGVLISGALAAPVEAPPTCAIGRQTPQ